MFAEFLTQYANNYAPYKPGGIWCYEDGCAYRGFLALYRTTGDNAWQEHITSRADVQVADDGTLRGYKIDEYNIDNILAGRVLFHLAKTSGKKYALAADLLARQLATHPRTDAGNYWHKKRYPHQVWLDGLYMGLVFQVDYAIHNHHPDLIDDAMAQLLGAMDLTKDTTTGLFYHGYDSAREQDWANRETGLSANFWSRAIGWLAMSTIDTLEILPTDHPKRPELITRNQALLETMLSYQTANGMWLQVTNQPHLKNNYEESSATAMMAYALLKTTRLFGDAKYAIAAGHALNALESEHLSQDEEGQWHLNDICLVAGLGGFDGAERDGSAAYYVSEAIGSDDIKGVGPLMMAIAEQNIRNAE